MDGIIKAIVEAREGVDGVALMALADRLSDLPVAEKVKTLASLVNAYRELQRYLYPAGGSELGGSIQVRQVLPGGISASDDYFRRDMEVKLGRELFQAIVFRAWYVFRMEETVRTLPYGQGGHPILGPLSQERIWTVSLSPLTVRPVFQDASAPHPPHQG